MDRSDNRWHQPGGSVVTGIILGVVTGFLTMVLPLYLDHDEAGRFAIGTTILALLAGIALALIFPAQRRSVLGYFWGVVAGAGLLVLVMLFALSQIGS